MAGLAVYYTLPPLTLPSRRQQSHPAQHPQAAAHVVLLHCPAPGIRCHPLHNTLGLQRRVYINIPNKIHLLLELINIRKYLRCCRTSSFTH